MTQNGSFPDRPRGRRARHGDDTPDWQGRDPVPDDEREFPDLAPIRGRRLSDADNRGLPGDVGPSGGRGRHSSGRDGAGEQGAPPWAGQARQPGQQAPYNQQAAQYDQRSQYGPDQYGPDQYGRPGQQAFGAGRASRPADEQYADQQYPDQHYPDQQYADPRLGQQQYAGRQEQPPPEQPSPPQAPQARSRRERPSRAAGGPSASSWDARDDEVTDDPMEAFSQRWLRRGDDSPHDARRRRRLWIIGGSAVAAIIIAAGAVLYLKVFRGGNHPTVGFGALITTFQAGELPTVPNACDTVSQATLTQYLPSGQPEIAAPPLNGGADSQCTWTLDNVPNYRVIEVDISALSPSGLARGNGSATNAAIDAEANDLQLLQDPPKGSGQPKATITTISSLGNYAFGATQVFNVAGTTTDKATVIVRYHNVILTTVVNGTEHAVTSKGTYGPVSMSTLAAAAQQVASEAAAKLGH
ncbi:MAG: hypothetical protein JWM19_3208 [Actinomycetia bacterium]|nr:hypothetical protein [Actinomycetes bacterium]